jgi:hypothetical protein
MEDLSSKFELPDRLKFQIEEFMKYNIKHNPFWNS